MFSQKNCWKSTLPLFYCFSFSLPSLWNLFLIMSLSLLISVLIISTLFSYSLGRLWRINSIVLFINSCKLKNLNVFIISLFRVITIRSDIDLAQSLICSLISSLFDLLLSNVLNHNLINKYKWYLPIHTHIQWNKKWTTHFEFPFSKELIEPH